MTEYMRYEGPDALKWTNQQSDAHWLVWLYERSTRMIVLRCRMGESYDRLGFLVLRGVQAVDMTGAIGTATFALSSSDAEHTDLVMEQDCGEETMHVLRIAGADQNTNITFRSFSVYELTERIEEDL
jgi:hypothetical protein